MQPRSQCFSPPRRGWAILSSAEKSPGNEVGDDAVGWLTMTMMNKRRITRFFF